MAVQPPPESKFAIRSLLGPGSIIGVLVGIVGPFIYSLLSERQLEISFDKLDYVSTSMLGNLIGLDVQRKPATLDLPR